MARPKKSLKAKEPVRIRFKELKNGNKSIYLDIYREGKRTYEFLKLYIVPEIDAASREMNAHSLALANKVKADRIIQLTNSEKGVTNVNLLSRMKLSELINLYEQWLRDNGKPSGDNSLKCIRKTTVAYRGDGITLRQVDKDYCIGYMKFLQSEYKTKDGRFLSIHTVCGYITILNAVLNWGVRNEYLKENPFHKVSSIDRPKKPESQRNFLQIDEIKKLINADCPGRHQVKEAFLFACYCGLRSSDIHGLTWGDLHEDNGQWRVAVVMEKTDTPLYLPLSEQAMRWLPERGDAADSDKIFNLPSQSCVNSTIKKWRENAGINKTVTFHVSRHTFATLMLTLDVDLFTTSKLLGHKNIATTQIYAKIIDKKKDDAVNRVNDIFKD